MKQFYTNTFLQWQPTKQCTHEYIKKQKKLAVKTQDAQRSHHVTCVSLKPKGQDFVIRQDRHTERMLNVQT